MSSHEGGSQDHLLSNENMSGICLAVRRSVLDKQLAPFSPGPIYDVDSMLGKEVNSVRRNAPLVRFSQSDQKKTGRPIENPAGKGVPGPIYEMDNITCGKQVVSTRQSASSPSFGRGSRPPLNEETCSPGPFTSTQRTSTDGPQYSFGSASWRNDDHAYDTDSPGPGTYQPLQASKSSFTFGGSNVKRDLVDTNAAKIPGPGQYRPEDCYKIPGGSTRFGNANFTRTLGISPEFTQGPGAYNIPSTLTQDNPLSTVHKPTTIVFSSSRPKSGNSASHPSLPGPGEYDTNDPRPCARVLSTQHSVRSFTFGSSKSRCGALEKVDTPSPLTYDPDAMTRGMIMLSNKSSPGGIKISSGGPRLYTDTLSMQGPGPQAYDPDLIKEGLKHSRKTGLINVKFGTGPQRYQDLIDEGESPGPGQYDVRSNSIHRAKNGICTFGAGDRLYIEPVEIKPGPQAYSPIVPRGEKSVRNINIGSGSAKVSLLVSGLNADGIYPKMVALPSTMEKNASSKFKSPISYSFAER